MADPETASGEGSVDPISLPRWLLINDFLVRSVDLDFDPVGWDFWIHSSSWMCWHPIPEDFESDGIPASAEIVSLLHQSF